VPAWKGRRVLVTGGTGFAGRRLVDALERRGCGVAVLASRAASDARLSRETVRFTGAVQDRAAVERAIREQAPDVVFHLAAQSTAGAARDNPVATFETNVAGTWTLLDACRRLVPKTRVVVASSDAVYGDQMTVPCDEDQPLAGRHPYEASKACADLVAQCFAVTYAMRIGIARASNLYGPGDINFSRIIPGTIRAALRGERPVIRSDGSPMRDYLHVDDMAEGFVALADGLESPALAGRAFNFATGAPVSVLALTRLVLQAAGRADLEPVVRGESAGDAHHKHLCIAAAARDLGWRPGAPLPERLAQTVAWYRGHFNSAATTADTVD
jgi:CDP-glucose 4,6-dehydratase